MLSSIKIDNKLVVNYYSTHTGHNYLSDVCFRWANNTGTSANVKVTNIKDTADKVTSVKATMFKITSKWWIGRVKIAYLKVIIWKFLKLSH